MYINETNLSFSSLVPLGIVKKVTIHHAAHPNCSVQDVHRWHQNNGWAGCGYHFFIRKDGTIYRGRPEDKLGAHVANKNSNNLGICFEGDFMNETMGMKQLTAGMELVNHLCSKYGLTKADVFKHRDLGATSCPGKHFPFTDLLGSGVTPSQPEPSKPAADTVYEKAKKYNSRNCLALQLFLIKRGYTLPKFGADGKYGRETHDKIGQFQRDMGLSVDYLVGPATLAKLAVLVRQGDSGELVRIIQRMVGSPADGDFGPNTKARVVAYQRGRGLSTDGIVGANTWREIFGV